MRASPAPMKGVMAPRRPMMVACTAAYSTTLSGSAERDGRVDQPQVYPGRNDALGDESGQEHPDVCGPHVGKGHTDTNEQIDAHDPQPTPSVHCAAPIEKTQHPEDRLGQTQQTDLGVGKLQPIHLHHRVEGKPQECAKAVDRETEQMEGKRPVGAQNFQQSGQCLGPGGEAGGLRRLRCG